MFLKTNIFKAISFRNPVKLPLNYWLLVALRFILTALPQTGYLHPDEFFQNVEVIAGDIFMIDVSKTWEFNPNFPVRNILVPKCVLGPPLQLIQALNPYTKLYLSIDLKTPYFLLVIPRLFICLLSFINDYCLYKICVIYGQNFRNRLTIFASSYVVLVYCCRSFSNSFETIFFSILLYLVADCMSVSDKIIYHDEFLRERYEQAATPVEKVKIFKIQNHLPNHSLNKVFMISTLVVTGIFNRPTFVGFALPPLFFWLQRGLGTTVVGFKDFHIRMLSLILCGIPMLCLLIIVDSGYYGYLTIADIESLKMSWDNWVVTPLNFLRYNMDKKNLTRHGLHPRWLHAVVNVPLLFNVLGGFAFYTLAAYTYRFVRGQYRRLPRLQSITGLMLSALLLPLALLSYFPHQEARFITPALLPLAYLHAGQLHATDADPAAARRLKHAARVTWYTLNAVCTLFFGFVHQGGIYQFTSDLHREIKGAYGVQTHVITTHSYSVPTFLLQLESTSRLWRDRASGRRYRVGQSTFLHKYGSMPTEDLLYKVDEVLTHAEMLLHEEKKRYRFYLAAPCSLDEEITEAAKGYYYFDLVEEFSYYPHFCSEALPSFPGRRDARCAGPARAGSGGSNDSLAVDLNVLQRISCYLSRFCLKVYSVKMTHKGI